MVALSYQGDDDAQVRGQGVDGGEPAGCARLLDGRRQGRRRLGAGVLYDACRRHHCHRLGRQPDDRPDVDHRRDRVGQRREPLGDRGGHRQDGEGRRGQEVDRRRPPMRAHLHCAQGRRHGRWLGQVCAFPRRERAQRVVRPGVRRDAQGRRDPVGGRCGLLVALGICCAAAEPDRAEAVDGVGAHWRPSLRHTKWQGPRGWLRDRVDLPSRQWHGRLARDRHRRHWRLR
mmetsp:Transcript_99711/g.287872  ORF Transcript_99711/g.287872 Transcript_99711/m.287872 type:complete len:230 (-) Transcript_99711:704-1393(-)